MIAPVAPIALVVACATAPLPQDRTGAPQAPAERGGIDVRGTRWLHDERTRVTCPRMFVRWGTDESDRRPYPATIEIATHRRWVDRTLPHESPWASARTYTAASRDLALTIATKEPAMEAAAHASSEVTGRTIGFAAPGAVGTPVERCVLDPLELVAADPDEPVDPLVESPAWLAVLRPGTDFLALLPDGRPPGPVAIDEPWKVPAESLRCLLAPAGPIPDLYGELEASPDPDHLAYFGGIDLERHAADPDTEWTGEVTVHPLGPAEGVERLRRYRVSFDVTLKTDPGASIRRRCEPFEMALVGKSVRNARSTLELEGHAVVDWPVGDREPVEVVLDADVSATTTFEFEFVIRGTKVEGDYRFEFEGTSHVELIGARGPR